ncbi:hypothetical protein DOTSEDRAFT_91581 [Dothistroma septosporum NZE10]|uniref:Tyrosine specific protein phosphatases domain-containing protein n=1 Tax=Dothistroma septosporum (strain NZE10 / CBS 128990) TaxID=675120 RepID=M2YJM8_DOTSN|nr:hypothetical protein DOTSEDRAFT_91581 [Dothistroma septosporum NZE10]
MAEVRPPFEKVLNFRDVATSINTLSGQHILTPGLFFRSGLPDEATPADRQRLTTEYHVKSIIDLRTDSEHVDQARKHGKKILASPLAEPSDPARPLRVPGIHYHDISLNGHAYSSALMKQLSYWNAAKLIGLYVTGYRNQAISILGHNVMSKRGLIGLAEDSLTHSTAEVKQIFDVLADEANYPVLAHCTQGKDRTGVTVLLVLLLLKAPLDAIDKDYMLSENELLSEREERLKQIHSIGLPDEFGGCAPGWVAAISTWIDEHYGSIETYLQSCGRKLYALIQLLGTPT